MRYWFLVVFSLFLTCPTWAASTAPTTTSPRSVYNEDGSFGFCLADYIYPDQRKLNIALSPINEINLGLTIPNGGFRTDAEYDLTLSLAKASPRKQRAQALNSSTLLLQFGQDETLLSLLQASPDLVVTGGSTKMVFPLPRMKKFLAALRDCITTQQKASVPPHATQFPANLQSLLTAAGMSDVRPLSLSEVPVEERPADFMWQNGEVIGGVRERLVPADKTLDDLIGLHLQGLKKKCPGAFSSSVDQMETAPGLQLRTALAECEQPAGDNITVALLFYRTAQHHFTVFTHESTEATKAAALRARQALNQALVQLAANNAAVKP